MSRKRVNNTTLPIFKGKKQKKSYVYIERNINQSDVILMKKFDINKYINNFKPNTYYSLLCMGRIYNNDSDTLVTGNFERKIVQDGVEKTITENIRRGQIQRHANGKAVHKFARIYFKTGESYKDIQIGLLITRYNNLSLDEIDGIYEDKKTFVLNILNDGTVSHDIIKHQDIWDSEYDIQFNGYIRWQLVEIEEMDINDPQIFLRSYGCWLFKSVQIHPEIKKLKCFLTKYSCISESIKTVLQYNNIDMNDDIFNQYSLGYVKIKYMHEIREIFCPNCNINVYNFDKWKEEYHEKRNIKRYTHTYKKRKKYNNGNESNNGNQPNNGNESNNGNQSNNKTITPLIRLIAFKNHVFPCMNKKELNIYKKIFLEDEFDKYWQSFSETEISDHLNTCLTNEEKNKIAKCKSVIIKKYNEKYNKNIKSSDIDGNNNSTDFDKEVKKPMKFYFDIECNTKSALIDHNNKNYYKHETICISCVSEESKPNYHLSSTYIKNFEFENNIRINKGLAPKTHEPAYRYSHYDRDEYGLITHFLYWLCGIYRQSSKKYHGIALIAHNGHKYDYLILKKYFKIINEVRNSNGAVFSIIKLQLSDTWRTDCKLIDSYKLINNKLADFEKMFGLAMSKRKFPFEVLTDKYEKEEYTMKEMIDFNFNGFKPNDWINNYKDGDLFNIGDMVKEYCLDDVLILRQGLYMFLYNIKNTLQKLNEKHQIMLDTTNIGLFKHIEKIIIDDLEDILTSSKLGVTIFHKAGALHDVNSVLGNVRQYFQQTINGGRVLVNYNNNYYENPEYNNLVTLDPEIIKTYHANGHHKLYNMQGVDANSLYPAAITRLLFPKGDPIKITPETLEYVIDLLESNKNLWFLGKVNVVIFDENKMRHIMPILSKVVDEIRQYKWESGEYFLTGNLYHYLNQTKYHEYMSVNIVDGYYYANSVDHNNNKIIVEELYNMRLELKKTKNPMEMIIKLILNSIYGYTGINVDNFKNVKYTYSKKELADLHIKQAEHIIMTETYLEEGSRLKMFDREKYLANNNVIYLNEDLELCGDDFYYCTTMDQCELNFLKENYNFIASYILAESKIIMQEYIDCVDYEKVLFTGDTDSLYMMAKYVNEMNQKYNEIYPDRKCLHPTNLGALSDDLNNGKIGFCTTFNFNEETGYYEKIETHSCLTIRGIALDKKRYIIQMIVDHIDGYDCDYDLDVDGNRINIKNIRKPAYKIVQKRTWCGISIHDENPDLWKDELKEKLQYIVDNYPQHDWKWKTKLLMQPTFEDYKALGSNEIKEILLSMTGKGTTPAWIRAGHNIYFCYNVDKIMTTRCKGLYVDGVRRF